MEHSVEVTESVNSAYSVTKRGKVFNLWLDIPDMEDDPDGVDNGYRYVGFFADFEDVIFAPDDQDFQTSRPRAVYPRRLRHDRRHDAEESENQ